MSSLRYLRYELLRTFRNRRFMVFALGFPLVLYLLIGGTNKNIHNLSGTGISAPLYFMVGMVSWGTMSAMLSSGGRIAIERAAGWNRQLRLTPLTPRTYFRAKVLSAYTLALVSMALLYLAGAFIGVHLSTSSWLSMTGLILVGLVPFAAAGIALGHLMTPESIGPALGGGVALLAFLGGTWFPIKAGFFHDLGQFLPSYWLVQASHVGLGGQAWPARAWITDAVWTVALALLAARAYERDTRRV